MKAKILFFSLVVLGFLLVKPLSAEDETRNVPSFTKISLRISGKLYLKQGNTQSVRIVAGSSTLEDIITEVNGDELAIRFPNHNFFWNSFNPGKIEIYITIPKIEGLSVSGSGDIIAGDVVKSGDLALVVSGSGNITLDELDAKNVKATVSGSGDIEIGDGGGAEEFAVTISGSGRVKAEEFEANDVTVKISGSGNCGVASNSSLEARIAGSGSVYYKGNPQINSSVSGSGKVRKL